MQITTANAQNFAPTSVRRDDLDELAARIEKAERRENAAAKRLQIHILCISLGIITTFALSFVDLSVIFHCVGIAAGIPSVMQEVLDHRHGW